jgi:cyclopropane fatty-acyl-phospholipid synthase-like methyltransferase
MNVRSYDAIAEQWDRQRTRLSPLEAEVLRTVADTVAPGSTILDLGCGTGRPIASFFVEAGHRIIGVDQSAAMLAFAKQRLPGQQWVLGNIEDVPLTEPVDAVVAWDSLFHIPRERHEGILQRIRGVLPVGGRVALTLGGSDHPAFVDEMFGHSFFYDSFPPEQFAALMQTTGYRIVHQSFLNFPDGGRDKGRVALVAAAQ